MSEKKECPRCNKLLDISTNFYSSRLLDKYPDGKVNLCKKCLTTYIDHYDTSTFVPILKELDVPYVEKVWVERIIKKTKGKTPRQINGTTVFGSYLSQIRLQQWKDKTFKDTVELNQKSIEEIKNDMIAAGRPDDEIVEVLETFAKMKNSFVVQEGDNLDLSLEDIADLQAVLKDGASKKKQEKAAAAALEKIEEQEQKKEEKSSNSSEIDNYTVPIVDLGKDLTDEDIKYLYIKWGQYSPNDWVQLENLWNQHMESFDIQTAAHKDYLKLICKSSLRANQFIDAGDIDGFNKVSKIYDQLMKSAKFTPVQNKEENGEYVSCLSELIAIAEKDGPIPRFYTPDPLDKVDETLEDIKLYTSRLIKEETNLGDMIEQTLNELRNNIQEKTLFDDGIEDSEVFETQVLTDADYEEFYENIEEQKRQDEGDDLDGSE